MKTFDIYAAQGDFFITKIDALPVGIEPVKPENGEYIIAHSETGHHHTIDADRVRMYRDPSNEFVAFLQIDHPAPIVHKRAFDTHEALAPKTPGVYRINRQREYTPEGFRRAAD